MFSDREEKVLKILGSKKISFMKIAETLFKDDVRFDENILVSNSVNRIIKKCEHHKLDWTLKKEKHKRLVLVTKEMM